MYWPAMIDKSQYNEWRNHPCTRFFRQYLKDYRARKIATETERWLNGGQLSDQDRGYLLALFDMEDVKFEFIENFYKELESESETTEHQESGISTGPVLWP